MKLIVMAGVSGLSVLMISIMLILSLRDEVRLDTQEASADARTMSIDRAVHP